jgi:hypothetical protein
VLRIDDGWGMTLSAASGVVWLTEESSPEDVVLAAGATHRIGRAGATVAVAHRAARVILEVPPGTRSPRRVELAHADGAPGIMVTLGSRARLSLSTLVTAAAIALRRRLRRTPTTDRGVSPDAGWSRARAAIARDDPFPYY